MDTLKLGHYRWYFGDKSRYREPYGEVVAGPFQPQDLLNLPKWISVKERLPPHDRHILGYSDKEISIYQLRSSDGMWEMPDWGRCCPPTHWMPLPAPPQA